MMNVQDCIVSAQLCIGNALEEMDKLAQLDISEQEQETLKSAKESLHQAVRKIANIVGLGPATARQSTKVLNNHLEA